MADQLTLADRRLVLAALERIATTLADMSSWVDDSSPERERCSIALEDACRAVQAAGWVLERADRVRAAELVHKRMSQPLYGSQQAADQG